MRAVVDAGLRVPEDVAVLGWDDPLARYSRPSVSGVSPDQGGDREDRDRAADRPDGRAPADPDATASRRIPSSSATPPLPLLQR